MITPLDRNYRVAVPPLISLSPSKIAIWQDCPRRFYLQYIARRRSVGVWAHLSLGQAIHGVLKDWFDEATTQRDLVVLQGLMREHWSSAGFANADQSAQWQDWAAAVTWQYLQGQQDLGKWLAPHSCERTLAARTDNAAIQGRIDRLDSDGDELVVIDYKTGSSVPGVDQVRSSLALALYAACVQQSLRRPCRRVELHHVPSGVVASWEHSDDAIARQLRRVDQIAQDMRDQEHRLDQGAHVDDVYPPNVSGLCAYCGFRDACPEGSTALQARKPWEGLPSLVGEVPEDVELSI